MSYFNLNSGGLKQSMRKELKSSITKIRDEMYKDIVSDLRRTPFKENPVYILRGQRVIETTDEERKINVLQSIVKQRVDYYSRRDLDMKTVISALGKRGFDKSYIGSYYEYGTGVYRQNFKFPREVKRNPHRTSKRIVSRDIEDNPIEVGGEEYGVYRDLGGNKRLTVSRMGGKPIPIYEVKSYRWFSRRFVNVRRKMNTQFKRRLEFELKKSLAHINFWSFLSVDNIRLGKKK